MCNFRKAGKKSIKNASYIRKLTTQMENKNEVQWGETIGFNKDQYQSMNQSI